MAEKRYQETCHGGKREQNLGANHYVEENIYIDVKTANIPAVVQTRLPQKNDQRDCEPQDVTKKTAFKWLVVSFIVATVIITAMFVTVFIMLTTAGSDQEDQQAKTYLENLEKNMTRMINEVDSLVSKDLLTIGKIVDEWYLASDWLLYKFFNERANYNTAKSRCEYFGGTLLAKGLRNASVLRELEENVLRTSFLKVWIGYYEPVEGSWIWLDGGATNTELVGWSAGEPNNNAGINEACGDMLRIRRSKAEINDDICSDKFPFVCERYF